MGYRVAVVGATGNVGREILNILHERQFPLDELAAVASPRSTGDIIDFGDSGKELKVKNLEHFDFSGWDIALFAAGSEVSKVHVPRAAAAGCTVIDNSSLYRMYDVFLADSMDSFVANYIHTKYSSQGASIRVAMEVLAAVIFLFKRKDFGFPSSDDRLWLYFSLASFAALVALVLTPSSTAVDRLSLYLMPLQMVILSRVPFVYTERRTGVLLVTAYSFAVQFVWLNFAQHARFWVPYHFYPLAT